MDEKVYILTTKARRSVALPHTGGEGAAGKPQRL